MKTKNQSIVLVHFDEYPFYGPGKKKQSEHDIILTTGDSVADYCQAIFNKILIIGLSELPDFLQYHSKQVREPQKWLNALEKLIKVNSNYFNNEDLRHRRTKLISQFDIHRFKLESVYLGSKRNDDLQITVKSFINGNEFDFCKALGFSKTLSTDLEKIVYLQNQIFEYRQNYIHKVKTFDELCQLEIDRLNINIELLLKAKLDKANDTATASLREKIRIKTNLNYFVDIFYQMLREWKHNGDFIIESSNIQIALLISNNFVDKKGMPISVRSVQTMLESSRPDKRPLEGKRFKHE